MTRLVVELLGGLRVSTGDGRAVRIPSRKAQALVACLALRIGTPVARDQLAGLLWDDSDAELARSSLRQALVVLRRCLPPEVASALVTDATSVALDAGLTETDLQRFRELVRDGSPDALTAAAEQYDGELLQGFDPRSAACDAWLDDQRRALRREWSQALQRAATQSRGAGDLAGAVAALSRLVSAEPTNEAAQRELMDAYARQGLYTEALRQFRVCSEALRRDLDVAPDPATEALYRDILRRRRAVAPGPDAVTQGLVAAGDGTAPSKTAAPPAESPALTTLREVVVLVARIGRMAGARVDDPESLRDDWSRAEARVGAVVTRLGGSVDRPGQGEIVTAFGLAATTGNEVERAVRAATELTAPAAAGTGPRLAIGIARGLVLPAGGGAAFPITGQPVAAAQALARAAPLDGTRLAPDVTLQVTAGQHPVPELAGRRAELAMLETLFERVAATRRGRAVVVRGEPGIGKSSLLEALATRARERGTVYAAHLLDFGQPVAERPLPAIAAQLLGIAPGASASARRAALEGALAAGRLDASDALPGAGLLALEPAGPAAGRLAAMDTVTRDRDQLRVLGRLLAHVAAMGPVLMIVEDAHWAEDREIAQLGELAGAIATLPVLLTLSTRTEGDPFSATWRARARGCPVTMLDLAPLADDEARDLAARYAGLSPDLLEHCLETAAGNPLFLVQLLHSAESGQTSLPGSIRALLLARVERLPATAQRLLHAAATLGARFSLEALRHVAAVPTGDRTEIEAAGLLTCEGEECRFTHELVRTVIYESLLRSTRRSLHQRAAQWFETRDAALHAEHLDAAEDPVAAAAHLRAAAVEERAARFDRALEHAERAVAVATSNQERCEAYAVLGDMQQARGRTEEAVTSYRMSTALATTPGPRARARLGHAAALRILDRYDEALEVLAAAERDAIDEGNPRRLGRVWNLRGNLYFPRGEFDRCLRAHERALELAQEACSVEDIARALGGLGDAEYQRGRLRTALLHVQRCLEMSEQHGEAALHLAYLPMAAAIRNFCGEFDAALELAQQAVTTAQLAGEPRAELIAQSVAGSTGLYRADYAAARERGERVIRLARELGAGRFEAEGLVTRGLGELGAGARREATATLEQAVARARESAPTYCGAWAVAALALAVGDPIRGRALLEEGEQLLAQGSVSHNHLEFRMLAIEFLLGAGDREAVLRQARALADYTREEPLSWADLVVARAVALADAQGRRRGPATVRLLQEALDGAERMGFEALAPRLRAALASCG